MNTIINLFLKIFALLGLIFMIPFLFVCSLFIFLEDGLPILFTQKRLGKNMRVFNIIKIRTMKNNTPNIGTHENASSDFLKIGKIIRKFKLDEFPQLINFLSGSINLVGPRPCLPNQTELKKARELRDVFLVKPGITGLSQILGYDMSNPEMLSIVDKIYIKNSSASLNIIIFFATFFSPLKKLLHNRFNDEILKMSNK